MGPLQLSFVPPLVQTSSYATAGGTTPIATHCATRAEFLRHSMYEAVSLNAIMTHESQRLYPKATFSDGFL